MTRPPTNHPLRAWRRLNGAKTLQEVADLVGVTQSHLSEIENWKNEPSLDLAARLHAHTGIDMKEFVRPTEPAQ
jgi:transcriptional regulator with XRE-family HTH domain